MKTVSKFLYPSKFVKLAKMAATKRLKTAAIAVGLDESEFEIPKTYKAAVYGKNRKWGGFGSSN